MELTKSQKYVLMNIKMKKNIFIQGVAGTGKTWLLKNISELTGRNVQLFATSGLASVNLGGNTISSNYGLKLGLYDLTEKEIKKLNSYKWNLDDIIVVDEVALLSEEQFKQVDFALRCRGCRNKHFGGFQLIIAGDFKQMPHIGWGKNLKDSSMLDNFKIIELVENVRQADDVPFFNILNKVRENGFTNEVINFIGKNQKKEKEKENGIQIVATRQLMDELNNNLNCPSNLEKYIYNCDLDHTERAYDSIKLWEGMPVIITKNNNRKGYYNGDTGVIIGFDVNDREVLVKLDRTQEEVWISFVCEYFSKTVTKKLFLEKITDEEVDNGYYDDEWFENLEVNTYFYLSELNGEAEKYIKDCISNFKDLKVGEINEINIIDKTGYNYMPVLPASYLSIRRCQGLTLTNGILHESILNADLYNSKDRVNIQYVALSRFEKINQVHVEGLKEEIINNSDTCCSSNKKEKFNFCPICGNKIIK